MRTITIEELKIVQSVGGVESARLFAQGANFLISLDLREGEPALLAKARSEQPREFANPTFAIKVLHQLGIFIGQFDSAGWCENEKTTKVGDKRGKPVQAAFEMAAYNKWLVAEIQNTLNDATPLMSHEEAMSALDTAITTLPKKD